MRPVVSQVVSAVLLFCLAFSAGDGLPWPGGPGARPAPASCCVSCSVKGGCCCGGEKADGDRCGNEEDASAPARCAMRPAGCDPETGLPRPTTPWNLATPVLPAGIAYVPSVSGADLLPIASPSDPFHPSVFRPPRA